MRYKGVTAANAKLLHGLMEQGSSCTLTGFIEDRGNGELLDQEMVEQLKEKLGNLRKAHPQGKAPGMEFDSRAAEIVHQYLKISPDAAGDADFWRWLTFAEFAEFVEWRHPPEKTKVALPENYGLGQITNNFMWRLWFRAEIVFLEGDDPYKLARKGDVDTWRSHILRVNTGSCRNYAKALIRYQHPEGKKNRLTVKQIRELAKRMNRLQATLALELLTDQETYGLVERVGSEIIAAPSLPQ